MHDEPIQDDIIRILTEHGIPMRDGRIRVKDISKALKAIGIEPTAGVRQSPIIPNGAPDEPTIPDHDPT